MSSRRGSWRKNRDIMNASIREAQAVVAEVKATEAADLKARIDVIRKAEAERMRFTAEEMKGAKFIRTDVGWHKVVRVSAKSVTVETGYSWTDRIPVGKVLEFRAGVSA